MEIFKKALGTIILVAILITTVPHIRVKTLAASIDVAITREYNVIDSSSVKVKESRVIKNNTPDKIITKEGNFEVFTITGLYSNVNNRKILEQMVSNAVIKDINGWNIDFSVEYDKDSVVLKAPYPQSIKPGTTYSFTFEYTNTQTVEKSGSLVDIFIQAFDKNTKFSANGINNTYRTVLRVPKDLGEENFVIPSPSKRSTEGSLDVYEFTQDQLLGNYVWVQRGKKQIYKFKITQNLRKTEETKTGNINEYRMVIPTGNNSVKISQEVYYTNISPEPNYLESDSNGNIIGVFKSPSNQDNTIVVEGYAIVESKQDFDINLTGTLSDVDKNKFRIDLSSAQYWEVDNSQIVSRANQIKGSNTSIGKIMSDTYNFITESIDYSNVKRFGLNIRQGALKTLNGGAAVCMEYSDLYIALLRAQGIPARAAFGYGYDNKAPSDKQELHQWAQVYVPTYQKWVDVDVTWGDNGPAIIGGDLNHFLTHTASVSPNDPSTLSGKTYGDKANFDPVIFNIEVLDQVPEEKAISEKDLLVKYPKNENQSLDQVVNSFGNKLYAGVESVIRDGVDFNNNAQLVLFGTIAFVVITLFFILSYVIKAMRKRRSIYS